MDIKYNVTKLKENKTEEIKDHVSVEEPLEMNLRFKKNSNWQTENLSITMRTPGNDEDLIIGFLFNERIVENVNQIIKVEKKGDKVGDYDIQNNVKNIVCGISASGPTKRWDVANYIKLFEMISSKFQCNFFIAGGLNDQVMIDRLKNSSFGKNCLSFSNLNIEQIIPIISSCNYYIGNDTGFGHLSASLNCKCLMIFTDSPPKAYGLWNNNIEIIVPVGETIDSCSHNTRGKDKISFDEVLKKSLKLIN